MTALHAVTVSQIVAHASVTSVQLVTTARLVQTVSRTVDRVSVMTVSKALRDAKDVSAETKARIAECAKAGFAWFAGDFALHPHHDNNLGDGTSRKRLLALLEDSNNLPQAEAPDVYLIHQGDAAADLAIRVAESLRDTGLDVVYHCGGGSFKSQMKRADASGAAYAVILGEDEIATGMATVKVLRDADPSSNQHSVALDSVADYLIDHITTDDDHEHAHLHSGQIHTHH